MSEYNDILKLFEKIVSILSDKSLEEQYALLSLIIPCGMKLDLEEINND